MNWYLVAVKKYADFSGRSRRMEYWMFLLINFLISCAIVAIEYFAGFGNTIGFIYSIAMVIPGLAVGVRRLHDTGRSGWWLFLGLIPVVGWLILLYFFVIDGEADNTYGPNPKGVTAAA
jgi:uncharacterized membrane protein YhaH (DUF805 family)